MFAGLEILGIFFKTNQADVTTAVRNTCKNVLPSSSVLYVSIFKIQNVFPDWEFDAQVIITFK